MSSKKTHTLNRYASFAALFCLCACGAGEPIPPSSPSSAEVADRIMEWWDGDYDNDAQIDALREDGAPVWQQGAAEEGQTFGGHLPVKSYYRPVSLPAFGDRVIYVEEKTFGTNPYRQRIYTVSYDDPDGEVRVKLWYFKDREKYLGAFADLGRIQALGPDDMSPLPDDCDLVVRELDDGRFHMKMPSCVFGDKLFDYQVILGPDDFWFRDRIADAESGLVTMTAGSFTYHKLQRVVVE